MIPNVHKSVNNVNAHLFYTFYYPQYLNMTPNVMLLYSSLKVYLSSFNAVFSMNIKYFIFFFFTKV